MNQIYVIKKSGEKELFNSKKVVQSLKNVGASEKIILEIMRKLEGFLYNGIQTREIFKFVFNELKSQEIISGTKYNLKQSIIDLSLDGGFVFEKFVEIIFKKLGYKTKINQVLKGKNITHEIDVVIEKDEKKGMIECKYFGKESSTIAIQTALYVYARFLDLNKFFNEVFLVTNTRFSKQVIDYSRGVGINLIGWKYPKNNSLEKIIERHKIYPITILPISKKLIRVYLEKRILTIEDLLKQENIPSRIRFLAEKLINSD